VIRINSQSGKGGVAYILEQALSIQIPRWLQIEFSQHVQRYAEKLGHEVSADEIVKLFQEQWVSNSAAGWQLMSYEINQQVDHQEKISVNIVNEGNESQLAGQGVGALDAFVQALEQYFDRQINIVEYNEHAMQSGSDARAMSFIRLQVEGQSYTGIAEHTDVISASLRALLNGMNQYLSIVESEAMIEKKTG